MDNGQGHTVIADFAQCYLVIRFSVQKAILSELALIQLDLIIVIYKLPIFIIRILLICRGPRSTMPRKDRLWTWESWMWCRSLDVLADLSMIHSATALFSRHMTNSHTICRCSHDRTPSSHSLYRLVLLEYKFPKFKSSVFIYRITS